MRREKGPQGLRREGWDAEYLIGSRHRHTGELSSVVYEDFHLIVNEPSLGLLAHVQ